MSFCFLVRFKSSLQTVLTHTHTHTLCTNWSLRMSKLSCLAVIRLSHTSSGQTGLHSPPPALCSPLHTHWKTKTLFSHLDLYLLLRSLSPFCHISRHRHENVSCRTCSAWTVRKQQCVSHVRFLSPETRDGSWRIVRTGYEAGFVTKATVFWIRFSKLVDQCCIRGTGNINDILNHLYILWFLLLYINVILN